MRNLWRDPTDIALVLVGISLVFMSAGFLIHIITLI
jgi:hypothetical protein